MDNLICIYIVFHTEEILNRDLAYIKKTYVNSSIHVTFVIKI